MARVRTETMAIADARQPDRLFTGGLAHPRQAMRITLQAPRPTCCPRSQMRCAVRTIRHSHRTTTSRDAGLMPIRAPPPYRHPDDWDGSSALIGSRFMGAPAVSGAHGIGREADLRQRGDDSHAATSCAGASGP